MMLKFVFQIAKKGKCQDTAPLNLQGAIMKDSYLDISGIPHWTPLPNLELYANAGYPFTRLADLSETAVVLPDVPSADELEMFLTFMGHFGAQTGYPVLNVAVTNADGMKADKKRDYIVMGTVDDQPALKKLNGNLPVVIDGNGLHIQDTQGFFAPLQKAWWRVRSSDHVRSGQLETAGGPARCTHRGHRVAVRVQPLRGRYGPARSLGRPKTSSMSSSSTRSLPISPNRFRSCMERASRPTASAQTSIASARSLCSPV